MCTKNKGFQSLLSATEIGTINGYTIWRLDKPLVYITNTGVEITVPAGFQTDLASVPRLPFIYMIWGDRAHREGVLHDYLYRIDSIPVVSKEVADGEFFRAMESLNKPSYIKKPMFYAVHRFAEQHYHRHTVDYEYIPCVSSV